jgi:hypothetical protein
MSIEEYNEELNKIKQFQLYLTKILDTGYMNEIEDLKSLTKQLDNINIETTTTDFIDDNEIDSDYDCIPFIPSNKDNLYSSSSPSSSDSEDEEYKLYSNLVSPNLNIDKEQEKINRFMTTCINNDIFQRCGNISLYRANGFEYIDKMKKFIKNSFIY